MKSSNQPTVKYQFDRDAAKTALRTAGALMIGNTVVVPVLTEFKNPYWGFLLLCGTITIIATCLTKGVSK